MHKSFEKIKMLATDVDGVLTDGGMYYFENRMEGKRFNTRDGMGIQLIKEKGIIVGFITKENNSIIPRRAEKLRIDFCMTGVQDKAKVLDHIRSTWGLKWEEVAYVGDDINDLGALNLAGIAICPEDAMPEVKERCNLITSTKGGDGVIREIYERFMKDS